MRLRVEVPALAFELSLTEDMFEPYYRQLRGVASLAHTPFGLGALLTTKALKLSEPDALMARTLPTPAKCLACKSAEGELRACSFCKSGIYHDNAIRQLPWGAACIRGVAHLQELPVVLPQVLPEGQGGTGEDTAWTVSNKQAEALSKTDTLDQTLLRAWTNS